DLPPQGAVPLVLRVDPAVLPRLIRRPVRVLLPHRTEPLDVLQRLGPGGHEGKAIEHYPPPPMALRRVGRTIFLFASISTGLPDSPSPLGLMRIFIERRAASVAPISLSVLDMSASTAPGIV